LVTVKSVADAVTIVWFDKLNAVGVTPVIDTTVPATNVLLAV
jgi:hypothetical protein